MIALAATSKSLDKNVKKTFITDIKRPEQLARIFFDIYNTKDPFVEIMAHGKLGAVGAFTGSIDYDEAVPGQSKQQTHTEYAKGFQIQKATWDDAIEGNLAATRFIMSLPSELAYRFVELYEEERHKPFNYAFSTTYTTLYGLALCSDSQVFNTGDSITNDNLITTALSPASLTTIRQRARKWLDDRGKLHQSKLSVLLVPSELEDDAHVYTKTPKKTGSNYNDLNPEYDLWNVRYSVRITSSQNYWGIDPRIIKQHFLWANRKNTSFKRDNDFDTYVHKYAGYCRFAWLMGGWHGVVGANVDGS
jgi:hypothetical protein